jgi:hypothetical protein
MQILQLIWIMVAATSCQYLPSVAQDIEEVATDTAIKIEVSKETLKKDTDLDITINVYNKDEPKVK